MANPFKAALLLCILIIYIGCVNAVQFNVGFLISEATLEAVNGIYICSSDSRCGSIFGPYTLSSTHAFVNGAVQKRWFISFSDGANTNLYGAIELSAEPEIQLKTWKRLGPDAAFEPDMKMKPVPHLNASIDGSSVLLKVCNVLLSSYTHSAVDRSSDRGRYLLSTLQHHRHLLHTTYRTHVLAQLFDCDYTAGLGGDAGVCYDNVITLLLTHSVTTTTPTIASTNSDNDITALQCVDWIASTITTSQYACHSHFAQLRRLRYSLLHEVNPLRALHLGKIMHAQYAGSTLNMYGTYSLFKVYMFLAHALVGTVKESTSSVYSVYAENVVSECDKILQYLTIHSNEAVHTLFTKLCMPYRSVTNGSPVLRNTIDGLYSMLGNRAYIDYHRSVVSSLLSVGAIGTTTKRTVDFIQYMLYDGEFSVKYESDVDSVVYAELSRIMSVYSSVGMFVDNSSNTIQTLQHSPNVRSALLLSHTLHTMNTSTNMQIFLKFVSYEFQSLASEFVNVLFHVTTPVVLSVSPVHYTNCSECNGDTDNKIIVHYTWQQEAVLLRTILVHSLKTLLHTCTTANTLSSHPTHTTDACALLDPAAHIAGRGLFLLAYQGLGLTQEVVRLARHVVEKISSGSGVGSESSLLLRHVDEILHITSDHTVPHLYEQLVYASSVGTGVIEPYSTGSSTTTTVDLPTTTNTTDTSTNITNTNTTILTAIHTTTLNAANTTTRKIKVGFISFFFRRHPVGRLLSKIITQLDRSVFDTYLIVQQDMYTHTTHTTSQDPITHYLHTNVTPNHIIRIPRDEKTALHTLRAANFDIIVYGDVFMDAFIAHLAMHRIGKVQVSFWGHPFTSGYNSIDYFVSSDSFERQGDKHRYQQYAEQVVIFDSLSFQLLLEGTLSSAGGGESGGENSGGVSDDCGDGSAEVGGSSGDSDCIVSTVYNSLPSYTLRGVHSVWDTANTNTYTTGTSIDTDTSTNDPRATHTSSGTNSVFYNRRREILRYITSIAYDIHDVPVSDVSVCEALSVSSEHMCSSKHIDTLLHNTHLYGTLQSLFKMHPMFDLAILHILLHDPNALILLSRTGKQPVWERQFRTRLINTITTHYEHNKTNPINTTSPIKLTLSSLLGRVLFVNQMGHVQYEQVVCSADVTLDTFPFGGGVTLSDGLGGCGVHMRTVYSSGGNGNSSNGNSGSKGSGSGVDCIDTRISPVVPFVTSAQLQSVHTIGAGMASKLNMSEYAYSVQDIGRSGSSGDVAAIVGGIVDSVSVNSTDVISAISRLRNVISSELHTTHTHYIQAYAAAAVETATTSHKSKMYSPSPSTHTKHSAHAQAQSQARVDDLLYHSTDAAKEWNHFLQRIVL